MYTPQPVSSPVPAVALTLLAAAKDRKLVICLGAGVSVARDANLPSGTRLGELLDERLKNRLQGYISPADVSNLIDVADAAVESVGGLEALQNEILELAEFRRAIPNYGHRALGLLLAEGAITALSWNWDSCIERSLPGELLDVARTKEEMANLSLPQMAKVHGCATMKSTLLITSEQLATPPVWTETAFSDRIRSSVMVFIGIGDVADYARRRIEQLLAEFGVLDVRVVSRSIRTNWETSVWAKFMPDLVDERRIQSDADVFLDELARAWANELVVRLQADNQGLRNDVQPGVKRVIEAISRLSSVELMRWCRVAAVKPEVGESAVRAAPTGDVVLAAGVLAATTNGEVTVPRPACCCIGDDTFELMVLRDRALAQDVQEEARRRAQELASNNQLSEGSIRFLVGGTVIGRLDGPVMDVLGGDSDPDDVVDGPWASRITYEDAAEVLRRAA